MGCPLDLGLNLTNIIWARVLCHFVAMKGHNNYIWQFLWTHIEYNEDGPEFDFETFLYRQKSSIIYIRMTSMLIGQKCQLTGHKYWVNLLILSIILRKFCGIADLW